MWRRRGLTCSSEKTLDRRQQERGHRAREAILRAAQTLFAQKGYDETTVEEIAKTAGVAVGSFYRHFRSKRQVLLVWIRCLLDEFDASRSTRQFNESPDYAIERLRRVLKIRWTHEGAYRAWREAVDATRAGGASRSD